MDVSKFNIDRNNYFSVAAAYEKSASSNNATAAAYSAYLDPSVFTKLYYSQQQQHQPHLHQQQQHQNSRANLPAEAGAPGSEIVQHLFGERLFQHIQPQTNLSGGRSIGGGGGSTNSIDDRESRTPDVIGADTEAVQGGSGPLSGNYSAYQYAQNDANNTATTTGSGGEYRRPLTVIF